MGPCFHASPRKLRPSALGWRLSGDTLARAGRISKRSLIQVHFTHYLCFASRYIRFLHRLDVLLEDRQFIMSKFFYLQWIEVIDYTFDYISFTTFVTGFIGKGMTRHINRIWNYGVKGFLGTLVILFIFPVVCVLVSLGSLFIALTAFLWQVKPEINIEQVLIFLTCGIIFLHALIKHFQVPSIKLIRIIFTKWSNLSSLSMTMMKRRANKTNW